MRHHSWTFQRHAIAIYIFSFVRRYMRKANSSIQRTSNSTRKQLSRWRQCSIFMRCKLRFVWKSKKSMCWPEMEYTHTRMQRSVFFFVLFFSYGLRCGRILAHGPSLDSHQAKNVKRGDGGKKVTFNFKLGSSRY